MLYSCFGQIDAPIFEEIKQWLIISSNEISAGENMRQILPLSGFGRIKYLWVSAVVVAQLIGPSLLTPKIRGSNPTSAKFYLPIVIK